MSLEVQLIMVRRLQSGLTDILVVQHKIIFEGTPVKVRMGGGQDRSGVTSFIC